MADTKPGDGNARQLREYWVHGAGLKLWASSPRPWTALYEHLLKYLPEDEAKRTATTWYYLVFHKYPGQR